MEPPINVFWDFLKNLKDLVVSVKIESAKTCNNGSVLAQLSNSEFKVEDKEGNVGICKLVQKETSELEDNEMSLSALILDSGAWIFIKEIVDNVMKDFKDRYYNWEVDNDSSQLLVLLKGI
jgi:hypothetical protein